MATKYLDSAGVTYLWSKMKQYVASITGSMFSYKKVTSGSTSITAADGLEEVAFEGGGSATVTLTNQAATQGTDAKAVVTVTTPTKLSDFTADSDSQHFTQTEKTKLSGIATGAEVNQNAFSNVKVGNTTVAADSKTDTLELVAGDNVTLTPDATNDKVTIAATDTQKVVLNVSGIGEGKTLKDSDNNTISYNDLASLVAAKKDIVLTVGASADFHTLTSSDASHVYFSLANVSTNETLSAIAYSISAGTGNLVNVAAYIYTPPIASFTDPEMDGIASVGYDTTTYARGDHRHPSDTSKQDVIDSSHKLSADLISDGTTNKVYTATEKTKLSGIAEGAEVNQNAFSNVKVGSTTVAADDKTDTLELVGSNVTITPDATNDKVTIGITASNVTTALGNTAVARATSDASGNNIADTYAPKASPALTGTPTAPTATAGTNTTQIATTAFVTSAIQAAQSGAAMYQGTAPTTFAPTNYKAGYYWIVGTAGTYAGQVCEPGDMIFANTDSATYSASHFDVIQTNLDIASMTTSDIDAALAAA